MHIVIGVWVVMGVFTLIWIWKTKNDWSDFK